MIPLVLVGDSSFAQIAKEYFDEEGTYRVQAFLLNALILVVYLGAVAWILPTPIFFRTKS